MAGECECWWCRRLVDPAEVVEFEADRAGERFVVSICRRCRNAAAFNAWLKRRNGRRVGR